MSHLQTSAMLFCAWLQAFPMEALYPMSTAVKAACQHQLIEGNNPSNGFFGICVALHVCESVSTFGFTNQSQLDRLTPAEGQGFNGSLTLLVPGEPWYASHT